MMFEKSWRKRNENAKKTRELRRTKTQWFLAKKRTILHSWEWLNFQVQKSMIFIAVFSDLSHQIKVNFHVGNKDYVLQILFTIAVLSCLRDLYSRSWTLLKILDSKVACFPTNICVFETSDTVQYSTMLFLKKYRGHSFSVLFFVYYLWLVVYVVLY